ncbi:MAG TPA: hypothetical protein VFB52_06320, partial [Solirubrobacterales bacterium]|nr:hypothetical protein [Solirubrobacterales bacterium]
TAFAGAAETPKAGTSAAKVSATLQKLKTQLASLRQQVKGLEGQSGTPRTPTGPAGGDLAGAYPNPLVGPNTIGAQELLPNSVGNSELQDNAVGSDELQNESVGGEKVKLNTLTGFNIIDATIGAGDIANNAIFSSQIADGSVGAADLGVNSVGSSELAPLIATLSAGKAINAGTPQNVSVTCPGNRTLIAGGYAWTQDEGNSIIASAPSEADPTHTWVVRGMVDEGSNTLFAWATCITG